MDIGEGTGVGGVRIKAQLNHWKGSYGNCSGLGLIEVARTGIRARLIRYYLQHIDASGDIPSAQKLFGWRGCFPRLRSRCGTVHIFGLKGTPRALVVGSRLFMAGAGDRLAELQCKFCGRCSTFGLGGRLWRACSESCTLDVQCSFLLAFGRSIAQKLGFGIPNLFLEVLFFKYRLL